MGDPLNRLFSSLEASFEAAMAAEDEVVAADLAMSLRQGRSLADVAARSGPIDVLRDSGARVPVQLVGEDFVIGSGTCTILFPVAQLVLVQGVADNPKQVPVSMIEVLRSVARDRGQVTLGLVAMEERRGRLLAAGPDHVCVKTPVGELLVGLAAIASVAIEGGIELA